MVRKRGFASLPELAGELRVSESTIRRDLEYLEGVGQARRTHGGVFYTGEAPEFPHFRDRQQTHWDKKRAIAKLAAGLVEDGETVLLDGGTTTYEVAQLLVGRPLQVVTNSMPVANLFASSADCDLVLIGGNVHFRTGVTMGPYANAMLGDLSVRHTILSVAAVNERGFFNSNILQVETQRAMLAACDEPVVVADSTKFGRSSLSRLCGLGDIGRVIVDDRIPAHWRERLTGEDIELSICEPEAGQNKQEIA
jgi:DeoR/GlpR family transcriptional regulator of sugar metabolism